MKSRSSKKRIAIFASGRGSNAKSIIQFSKTQESTFDVGTILSNRKHAGVLPLAIDNAINTKVFTKDGFYKSERIVEYLFDKEIDLVVLAGFLWLIPKRLIDAYPERIINIHPALLPKYGGEGMYGSNVHRAVKKNNEKSSGITIHFVDEEYDKGNIIFQSKCPLSEDDSAEDIGQKVLELEHHFYPEVINGLCSKI